MRLAHGAGLCALALAVAAEAFSATPDLTVTLNHSNGFTQGQTGARYTATVRNVGNAPSVGTVSVIATLPTGFAATSIAGAGWSCSLANLTCTRSDELLPGGSYSPIQLVFNVGNQIGSATTLATVSGGGDGNGPNNVGSDTAVIRAATNVSLGS